MKKTIYCIRHGTAKHNVMFPKIGEKAYYGKENLDTRLEKEGIAEAEKLGREWDKKNIELVVVSPLTRTLQTASAVFKNSNIHMISHDLLREYSLGLQTCNKRKNISELRIAFSHVDFSLIKSDHDDLWNHERLETEVELSERVKKIKNWLKTRNEKTIAIVSHSTFLQTFLYDKFDDDEDNELKHCFPYVFHL